VLSSDHRTGRATLVSFAVTVYHGHREGLVG
jgi:hypothetical protein